MAKRLRISQSTIKGRLVPAAPLVFSSIAAAHQGSTPNPLGVFEPRFKTKTFRASFVAERRATIWTARGLPPLFAVELHLVSRSSNTHDLCYDEEGKPHVVQTAVLLSPRSLEASSVFFPLRCSQISSDTLR
jgi:hypothetical protein